MPAPRPTSATKTRAPTCNGADSEAGPSRSTNEPARTAAAAAAAIVRTPASARPTTEQLTTVIAPATIEVVNQKPARPSSTNDASSTHVVRLAVVTSHVDHGVTTLMAIQPTSAARGTLHIGAPAIASVEIDAALAASGATDSQTPPSRRALPADAAINATLQSASGMYQRPVATTFAGLSQRATSATSGDASAAVASPAPSGTVVVRARRRQIESTRAAAMVSVASVTIAGTQNQTIGPDAPLTSDVEMPDPSTATLTTARGAFCRRCASTATTAAAIAQDNGADHTSTSPAAPIRDNVPVPIPASANATSSGEAPTATASVKLRRVEPRSSAATDPTAPIAVAGTAVSAASPTAARPNETTVAAFSAGTFQRRDCTSVAPSAATPPTSVHTDQGWPSVAAAATPTGAVRQAASTASEVDVVRKRRRPVSAAK